jgi:outer membrane protein assembly factor BamB
LKKVILLIGFIATVLMFSTVVALEEKMGLELVWAFNTSEAFPDKSFGAGHQGSMTIYDIDGDGTMEVLFGTRRGDSKRGWCINGEDGTLQWIYPPLGEDGLPGDPTSKWSIVDVNGDGNNELCLAGRGGRLHVVKPDGSILWTWDQPVAGDAMHGAPQGQDVDGDGNVEFFMNCNAGYIYRVSHLGELVWTSAQAGKGNQGQPTLADIDQDGEVEVLFASQDFNLYCINAATGQEEWRFDTGANQQTNQVIVADVNMDGEYEAITWTDSPSSAVFIVSFYGTELARWTHPREGVNIRICQAMGDVNGDGTMDMAIMSGDAVFAIDVGVATPTTLWEANFTDWSATGKLPEGAQANHWGSYQLIADIDADGAQEILWLAPWPIVTDAATGALEGYYVNEHMARNRRQENGAGWGDVNGDGKSEWVAEVNGNSHPQTQIYCFTMGGAFPAPAMWPEYYHSALPADEQIAAGWLKTKASGSNSLFFPMPEFVLPSIAGLLCIGLLRRRK